MASTTIRRRAISPNLPPAEGPGQATPVPSADRAYRPHTLASSCSARRLRQARIYDLRSTFASNALAAGVSVFELARIMGTSGEMIESKYGTLIEGAGADIARRLGAFEQRSGDVVATEGDR